MPDNTTKKSDSLNQPVSDSLLLSDEEIIDVYNQPADGLDTRGFEYEMEKRRSIAKAQLQHLIDLGWRPSSLPNNPAWHTDERLYEAFCAGQNSLIQVGWKSPSEVEALIKDSK